MLSVTSFEFVEITGEIHAFINKSKIIETIFYYHQTGWKNFRYQVVQLPSDQAFDYYKLVAKKQRNCI